jgi:hypothetical protein
MRSSTALVFAFAFAAAPLGAQEALIAAPAAPAGDVVAFAPAAFAPTAPAPAPALERAPVRDAAVGARPVTARPDRRADAEAAAAAAAPRRGHGKSVALMVVGGSAIVLGALAGNDVGGILILGGAVVGGIGLYQYLQ